MDCCEFRERYSDFADGLLDDADEQRVRHHLARCAGCRRFDVAFQAGVSTLRGLPSVQVSRGFAERLHGRLRRELLVRALAVDPWSGAVGALLVVAIVGVVAWDVTEWRAARHAPAVAVSAPPPAPAVQSAASTAIYDSSLYLRDTFHPWNPALLVADTAGSTAARPARLDIPAVWGGR
jgi:anti-sigma factor RsiW